MLVALRIARAHVESPTRQHRRTRRLRIRHNPMGRVAPRRRRPIDLSLTFSIKRLTLILAEEQLWLSRQHELRAGAAVFAHGRAPRPTGADPAAIGQRRPCPPPPASLAAVAF